MDHPTASFATSRRSSTLLSTCQQEAGGTHPGGARRPKALPGPYLAGSRTLRPQPRTFWVGTCPSLLQACTAWDTLKGAGRRQGSLSLAP